MNKLRIDFWSDITCPFCYIAEVLLKRELMQIDHYAERVEVVWRSCLLMPDKTLDYSITWAEKLAKEEDAEARAMFEKKVSVLKHLADKYGLDYHLDQAHSHNSQRAARLLKVANEKGLTLELATRFGQGFFSLGKDFSKAEELREVALAAGLSAEEVSSVLDGDLYLEEVSRDQELSFEFAPNYVPTIYFGDKVMLEGVVKPEQIREALQQSLK